MRLYFTGSDQALKTIHPEDFDHEKPIIGYTSQVGAQNFASNQETPWLNVTNALSSQSFVVGFLQSGVAHAAVRTKNPEKVFVVLSKYISELFVLLTGVFDVSKLVMRDPLQD